MVSNLVRVTKLREDSKRKRKCPNQCPNWKRVRMQVVLGHLDANKEVSSAIAVAAELLGILRDKGKTKNKAYFR